MMNKSKLTGFISNKKDKNKDHTPMDDTKKLLVYRLLLLFILLIFSLALFYGASLSKERAEKKYSEHIKENANKELTVSIKQINHILAKKTEPFNNIFQKNGKATQNFTNPSQLAELLNNVQDRLGKETIVEMISAHFDENSIIDNPNMGYAILVMLNELKASDNNIKIEAHGLRSKDTQMVFIKKIAYFDPSLKTEIVIAYLMAKIPKYFFNELSASFKSQMGYFEMTQTFSGQSALMLKSGDQALKMMPISVKHSLNANNWYVKFWPVEQITSPSLSFLWLAIVLLALGVLGVISSLILLFLTIKSYQVANHITMPDKLIHTHQDADTKIDSADKEITDILHSDEVTDAIYGKDHGVVVQGISEDENIEACIPKIFRSYDICGVVGECINASIFKTIAHAFAKQMVIQKQKRVSIAYDGRTSSSTLVKAIIEGMLESGIDVVDVDQVTTPMLYFSALTQTDGNGIMVTGGHNPADYNGLKIILKGQCYRGDVFKTLKKRVIACQRVQGEGQLSKYDIRSDYMNKITANVILARPLKVVVDTGNGIAGLFASTFFEQLGCTVSVLNNEVEGDFPVHDPDPDRPENLIDLIKQVKEDHADLGIAFGGDGVRIGLISSAGEIICPDRVLMLLAKDILSRHKQAGFLYDATSSKNVEPFIKKLGGTALMYSSGDSLRKNKLAKKGLLLAGEMNGHIFIRERWFEFDDAFFAAARILEILAIDLRKSRQVFAELPDSIHTPKMLIKTNHSKLIMKKIRQDLSVFKRAKIITIDGIRAEYSDGWGIIRISNTAENLMLCFEADNKEALQRIINLFKEILLNIDKELEFPF